MAVESNHNLNWSESGFTLEDEDLDVEKTPSNRVLKFRIESFRPNRIPLIKRRIQTLLKRMLACPNMRSAYILEINKLILYEKGEI